MELSAEAAEFHGSHQWAVLSTGRRDGSPQAPRDETVRRLDDEDHTVGRIHATTVFLNV